MTRDGWKCGEQSRERMRIPDLLRVKRTCTGRERALATGAAVAALLLAAVSCQTVNRSVVLLPDVPGAKYIGSKECEQCHEELCRDFQTADHARLIAEGPNALGVGCESCHGPASAHADSGGEVKPPYSFSAQRPRSTSFAGNVMGPGPRATETVCFQCHGDVRGQFNLPSHHPVPEGWLKCTECHSPHKGSVAAGGHGSMPGRDASCLACHPAQRGPYVFEHEALREGCTTCHTPHGSVNAKLLSVRDANLCLKCHFQRVQGGLILIGGADHTTRLSIGTCWTAGCHEAVHGSRVNSSLRF
jgi:predicted CXXCH cytochrome family protein